MQKEAKSEETRSAAAFRKGAIHATSSKLVYCETITSFCPLNFPKHLNKLNVIAKKKICGLYNSKVSLFVSAAPRMERGWLVGWGFFCLFLKFYYT